MDFVIFLKLPCIIKYLIVFRYTITRIDLEVLMKVKFSNLNFSNN